MTRVDLRVSCAVLALAAALGPVAAVGQELPPEIQMDLYLVRADRHMQAQEWAAALEALDVVLLLQADQGMATPAELWFDHANAALQAGYPETAVTSATRYLQEAGRGGGDYENALLLLDEAMRRTQGEPTPAPQQPAPAAAAGVPPAAPPAPTAAAAAAPVPAPAVEPGMDEGGLTVLFPLIAVNAATMAFTSSGALSLDPSQVAGVGGGFAVVVPVPGPVNVQVGAQFAEKGARTVLAQGEMSANADFAFRSVDFTALARYPLPPAANLSFHALVGPYASFEVDCRLSVEAAAATERFSSSDDCAHLGLDTQSVDFGVSGGVGFEVGTGETRITGGALYNYGIQDINKVVGATARHRVLNIHVGVAKAF